jgi:hypothetical protein
MIPLAETAGTGAALAKRLGLVAFYATEPDDDQHMAIDFS